MLLLWSFKHFCQVKLLWKIYPRLCCKVSFLPHFVRLLNQNTGDVMQVLKLLQHDQIKEQGSETIRTIQDLCPFTMSLLKTLMCQPPVLASPLMSAAVIQLKIMHELLPHEWEDEMWCLSCQKPKSENVMFWNTFNHHYHHIVIIITHTDTHRQTDTHTRTMT